MFNKRGQVWIETMIYTLIAFSMIALVLAYAKPKIEEFQDKAIIDQSILMLEEVDSIILTIVQGGPGNIRIPQLLIKKGSLVIDAKNDILGFEMESRHMYSELNQKVQIGGMIANTTKKGGKYNVLITREYPRLNITYADKDILKYIGKAPTKQALTIKNNGEATSFGLLCVDSDGDGDVDTKNCADTEGSVVTACAFENTGDTSTKCKYKSEKITINMEIN